MNQSPLGLQPIRPQIIAPLPSLSLEARGCLPGFTQLWHWDYTWAWRSSRCCSSVSWMMITHSVAPWKKQRPTSVCWGAVTPPRITTHCSYTVVPPHWSCRGKQSTHSTRQEIEVGFILFIYFSFSVKWLVMFITHTIMRRIFTFVHLGKENKHYTALNEAEAQTGGEADATHHTGLRGDRGTFGTARVEQCCHTTFPSKHLIMCQYRVSYRAPFWNCVFFIIIHQEETQHIVFW